MYNLGLKEYSQLAWGNIMDKVLAKPNIHYTRKILKKILEALSGKRFKS